jgi:MFS family permease
MLRLPPALRYRDFALLWVAVLAMNGAAQIVVVAVGWQVYSLHEDPFDLGLIGLAQFIPLPLLALPAGQLADRLPRRLVFATALVLEAAVTSLLLVVSLSGVNELWPFLVLAAANGSLVALGTPAARALPPTLIPANLLASALALRSIAFQIAIVAGPAIGGLLFAISPEVAYGAAIGLFLVAFVMACALRAPATRRRAAAGDRPLGLTGLLEGVRLIRRTPVLLGAILLDLFAVLFGGAVALLPLFAKTILETGPVGLGVLRTAPAVGALMAAAVLTRRPLGARAGRTLLVAVAVFGASMIVFGLSKSFLLSFFALLVGGLADMVSVNIRSTTVALASPDPLRGRVLAVEMVFISASNELGAFESGAAAALIGAVPAVVAGGAITIALAIAWTRLFPAIARLDRLEEIRPAPAGAT